MSSATFPRESNYLNLSLNRTDYAVMRSCLKAKAVQPLHNFLCRTVWNDEPNLSYSAGLKRTQRSISKLLKAGLLECYNPNQKPRLYGATLYSIDLLSSAGNSNFVQRSPFVTPLRCSQERKDAIKTVQVVSTLSEETRNRLADFFESYLNDIDDKRIILLKRCEASDFAPEAPTTIEMHYSTRFNNAETRQAIRDTYDNVWETATARFQVGVHLTLTTDPKRFPNLWTANRHMSKALNRFFSYLKKYLKRRPYYVSVYEYTRSGLIHAHIVFFGLSFLLSKDLITQEWERCGQGTVNYVYALKNHNGKWVYKRKRPPRTRKGTHAKAYLEKYLKKGSEDPKYISMYWVHNKRFFTHSRSLKTLPSLVRSTLGIYAFLMTCYVYDTPDCVIHSRPCYKDRPPPLDIPFG